MWEKFYLKIFEAMSGGNLELGLLLYTQLESLN